MRQFLINFALHGLERGAYPQSVPRVLALGLFQPRPPDLERGRVDLPYPVVFCPLPGDLASQIVEHLLEFALLREALNTAEKVATPLVSADFSTGNYYNSHLVARIETPDPGPVALRSVPGLLLLVPSVMAVNRAEVGLDGLIRTLRGSSQLTLFRMSMPRSLLRTLVCLIPVAV